ncbi:hypothetical protein LZP69_11435 [Shewanella sp. AS1]|uniref:FimV/HubP family polar landmark protein n=1 Tax=Shewanella sp. AS1 TaxID=2907626 RepID=UPI001F26E707|nr:FimV/HubP family polar landmark protein [Shewanella sp. AS1]MCE9679773.1 hypothetical protein [Shewanella sp. AS1]
MKKLTYTLLLGALWGGAVLGSFGAWADISHVSINQQQFVLGAYPKFKINIVAQDTQLDRVQFILSQRSGSERLMVRPLSDYLLEVTGIEDVTDPDAQLIVKEYQVNRWVDVERIALFDAQSADLTQVAAANSGLAQTGISRAGLSHTDAPLASSTMRSSGQLNPQSIEAHCQLNYKGGQTLWRLASQYSGQWNLSPYGAMLAIFDANPKAFNRGDIHGLRADVRLNCPSSEVKQRYLDAELAKQTFEAM